MIRPLRRFSVAAGLLVAGIAAGLLVAGIAAGLATARDTAGIACPIGALDTAAQPAVNLDHIFCGEINARGRAVGFHSRPGGANPATVRDTGDITRDAPFPGAYEIRDFTITVHGVSRTKAISTMYPDACGREEVVAAIRHAYQNRTSSDGNRFFGPSGPSCRDAEGREFDILGYTSGSGAGLYINTAFPQ